MTSLVRQRVGRPGKLAFSLIELLVVIAIISILVSLTLPSLQQAKDLARKVICSTRLSQIGVASNVYAESYGDRFPQLYRGDANGQFYWWHRLMAEDLQVGETSARTSSAVCPADPEPYQPFEWLPGQEHLANSSYGMNPWVSFIDGGNGSFADGVDDWFGASHDWPTLSEMARPAGLIFVGEVWHGGSLEYDTPNIIDPTPPMWNQWHWSRHSTSTKENKQRLNLLYADGHVDDVQRHVDVTGLQEGDADLAARQFQP